MPYCTQCGTWFEGGTAPTEVRCRICRESPAATSAEVSPTSAFGHRSPDDFDPYYNWLGIPPARQPPHHYHLLGIAEFEANTEVISNAYEQRVRHVRTFQLGERSAYSQKLLSELAAARLCLMNPQQKAAHDQSILGAMASAVPTSIPATAASVTSVPTTSSPAPLRTDQLSTAGLANFVPASASASPMKSVTMPRPATTRTLRQPRHRRGTQKNPAVEVVKIVLGGVAGCVIAWFIIYAFFAKSPESQSQVAKTRPVASSPPVAVERILPLPPVAPSLASVPTSDSNDESPLKPSLPNRPRPNNAFGSSAVIPASASNSTTPDPPSVPSGFMPSSNPAPPAATPSRTPVLRGLSHLPVFVSLPSTDSRQRTPLGLTKVPDDVEITFSNDFLKFDSAYSFITERDDEGEEQAWKIHLQKSVDNEINKRLVAIVKLVGQALSFQWDAAASDLSAGQLRNCSMSLSSAGETREVALRSPVRQNSTQLPPELEHFQVSYDLQDLPKPEALRMDVALTYKGSSIQPKGNSATTTRGNRLDFPVDRDAGLDVQVTMLVKGDAIIVQALPRLQLLSKRDMTVSEKDVDAYETRLLQALKKAERDLADAERELSNTQSLASGSKDAAVRDRSAKMLPLKAKAVGSIRQSGLETQQALTYVKPLRDLVSSVRKDIVLRYRVYAAAGESQLLLVDAGFPVDAVSTSTPALHEHDGFHLEAFSLQRSLAWID